MESLINFAEEQQPSPVMTNSWSKQEAGKSEMPKYAGGFVLVHAGAGYHSESKAKEYKHVCKRACQRAVDQLRAGALAVEAVTAALVELEDSPFTNAGMGSNLNLSGEIECDASIMDGKSLHFGAVGSISGIKNPVLVANCLLTEAQKGKLSAGRIPPCFLVGRGAHDWAISHGIPPCPSEKMATKFSLSAYKRNKRKMEMAEKMDAGQNQEKKRRQSSENENGSGCLDTVGAVVVDSEGNVAAAVSSGGLAMKHPGRVGQAAHYGCGSWAENACNMNSYSAAVSTSGCGEHLIRTMLARECSAAMQSEDAHQALLEAMQNKFINDRGGPEPDQRIYVDFRQTSNRKKEYGSPFLVSEDRVLGGVIVLRCCRCVEAQPSPNIQGAMVEFLWSHTTESMCVGYMSAQDSKAKTHISRLPPGTVPGKSLAIEGGVCRLTGIVD
ncbi:threonine aspartase 1 isoform X4 [Girardinichthys multiradiatus]|uniref:threonine aspartase 1 isoform X4 n=1 Tax=Girardinichthys multiradiatus TaxID=208333 RepID=UPI001FAC164C|nr:threonine aspartase 1 isoform X4 [Girardinichthys multiradiatus]XP_047208357.1 threonine aspartase 1 isoform X4 [Girardinichthys multiradiatus]XP_047208358.1 threonine aspartase 1 isoform X4 [Girardinichthys multiradiatus]XP_047208359.1 threonine aspartase 1 isoform X4 [Girardinichthys multiradiatus]